MSANQDGEYQPAEEAFSSSDSSGLTRGNIDDAASSQHKRKARGATRLCRLVKRTDLTCEFNKFGRPIGKNAGRYAAYVGLLAKENMKITVESWKHVKTKERDRLWAEVKAKWNIPDDRPKTACLKGMNNTWKSFKSVLVSRFLAAGKSPCEKYPFITEEIWEEFTKQKGTPEFKALSEKNKGIQKRNDHPHRLRSRGYAGKDEQWRKEDKENALVDSSDLPTSKIGDLRCKRWWRGRASVSSMRSVEFSNPKDTEIVQQMISAEKEATQGFTPQRENDVLTRAVGNKEHLEQTRTVGVVPWKDSFKDSGPPRKRACSLKGKDLELYEDIRAELMAEFEPKFAKMREELRQLKRLFVQLNSEHLAAEVNTTPFSRSSSCSSNVHVDPVDLLEKPKSCSLVTHLSDEHAVVAHGFVYPSGEDVQIHSIPLKSGFAKVQVHTVFPGYTTFALPVPTEKIWTIAEALGSYIQWPKQCVIIQEWKKDDNILPEGPTLSTGPDRAPPALMPPLTASTPAKISKPPRKASLSSNKARRDTGL